MTARALMKAGSQSSKLLAHLMSGRTITGLQALQKYGVMACSQRMTWLRKRGHVIRTEMVTFGDKTVARYRLVKS